MSNKPLSLLAAVALLAVVFACGAMFGQQAASPAIAATSPAAPDALYELRIYTAAAGKLDALHARFRDHTLRMFEKHGIKSVAYWTGVEEGHRDKLYYVVSYPNQEARTERLMNGIAKDPEFLKAVAESEKEGKLTSAIESIVLTPTNYSPLR